MGLGLCKSPSWEYYNAHETLLRNKVTTTARRSHKDGGREINPQAQSLRRRLSITGGEPETTPHSRRGTLQEAAQHRAGQHVTVGNQSQVTLWRVTVQPFMPKELTCLLMPSMSLPGPLPAVEERHDHREQNLSLGENATLKKEPFSLRLGLLVYKPNLRLPCTHYTLLSNC